MTADDKQAAAIAAAIAAFEADTAPTPTEKPTSNWQRTALLEGVSRWANETSQSTSVSSIKNATRT